MARIERVPEWWGASIVATTFAITTSPVIFRDNAGLLPVTISILAVIATLTSRGRTSTSVSLSLFVLWACASTLWTSDMPNTLLELVTLLGSVAAGLALATLGTATVARGLLNGALALTLASLLVGMFLPALGRSDEFEGALTGVYAHRNLLASVTVIGFALAISYIVNAHTARDRLKYGIAATIFGISAFLTSSGSAILLSGAIVSAILLLRALRTLGPLGRFAITSLVLSTLTAIVIVGLPQIGTKLAELVGRDLTFTGRINIWAIVLDLWAERPLLGYGWGGVWRGVLGDDVRAAFGYATAKSAHSAFLEVLLQLGLVGLVLFVIMMMRLSYRSVRLGLYNSNYLWLPIVLLAILVNSVSESQATRPMGTFLIAIIVGTVNLEARRSMSGTKREVLAPKLTTIGVQRYPINNR